MEQRPRNYRLPNSLPNSPHPIQLCCRRCKTIITPKNAIFRIWNGNFWAFKVQNVVIAQKEEIHRYKSDWSTGRAQPKRELFCGFCETRDVIGHFLPGYVDSGSNQIVEYKLFGDLVEHVWTDHVHHIVRLSQPPQIPKHVSRPTERYLEEKFRNMGVRDDPRRIVRDADHNFGLVQKVQNLTQKVKEYEEKELTCSVCFESENLGVFDCGHYICKDCKDEVEFCPTCRSTNLRWTRTYN